MAAGGGRVGGGRRRREKSGCLLPSLFLSLSPNFSSTSRHLRLLKSAFLSLSLSLSVIQDFFCPHPDVTIKLHFSLRPADSMAGCHFM